MADLIAIGYPDERTATDAQLEAERLAHDLGLEPDAVAAIVRSRDGKFKVQTSAHASPDGAAWGLFWELLFSLLVFVPVLGAAVGPEPGALMAKIEEAGVDAGFRRQAQDLLQPGTSALFLVVDGGSGRVTDALSRYGGTPVVAPLSRDVTADLRGFATDDLAASA